MPLEILMIFIPASFALNLSPGPNNILAMNNGVRFGFWRSLIAGLGRIFAFILMIALTAVGLSALLTASELAFYLIKYLGALYLIYLGIKIWRSPVNTEKDIQANTQAVPLPQLIQQEFLIAIGNPKAILIFTAFFPQFITPELPSFQQFAVIGATFLTLETIAIAIYAISGRQLGAVIQSTHGRRILNRLSGGILVGAGAILTLTRRMA